MKCCVCKKNDRHQASNGRVYPRCKNCLYIKGFNPRRNRDRSKCLECGKDEVINRYRCGDCLVIWRKRYYTYEKVPVDKRVKKKKKRVIINPNHEEIKILVKRLKSFIERTQVTQELTMGDVYITMIDLAQVFLLDYEYICDTAGPKKMYDSLKKLYDKYITLPEDRICGQCLVRERYKEKGKCSRCNTNYSKGDNKSKPCSCGHPERYVYPSGMVSSRCYACIYDQKKCLKCDKETRVTSSGKRYYYCDDHYKMKESPPGLCTHCGEKEKGYTKKGIRLRFCQDCYKHYNMKINKSIP